MTIPINAGRLFRGAMPAIIVNAPLEMPDTPMPAMARPTINILEELATPQIREPISKTTKNPMYVHYKVLDCVVPLIGHIPWH